MEKDNLNIFVIAGGPSAAQFDLSQLNGNGYKLGVNDSFRYTPCQGVFSMDRKWFENRMPDLRFGDIETHYSMRHWSKSYEPKWPNLTLYTVNIDQLGLNRKPGILNCKNSGFGALNLAYHMGAKRIFLFGFDLTLAKNGAEHWYKNYEWRPKKKAKGNYANWIADHVEAAKQLDAWGVKVYNVSPISVLTCYPKIEFKDIFNII